MLFTSKFACSFKLNGNSPLSNISIRLLKRLNAHIIKKPKKPFYSDLKLLTASSPSLAVIDLKQVVGTLRQVLFMVHYLISSNNYIYIGVLDKASYNSIRTLFNLDLFFYPVYPWYPGLLTNFKKIKLKFRGKRAYDSAQLLKLNRRLRARWSPSLIQEGNWFATFYKVPSLVVATNPTISSRIIHECVKVDVPSLSCNYTPSLHTTPSFYSVCLNFQDPELFRVLLVLLRNQQYKTYFSRYSNPASVMASSLL